MLKRVTMIFLAMTLFALRPDLYAADLQRIAVIELGNSAGWSDDEAYYLTDLVRGAARSSLPRESG